MAKKKSPAFSLWVVVVVVVVVLGGFLVEEAHGASTPSHEGKPRPPVVELPGVTLAFGPAKTPSHKGKPRPPIVELPGDTLGFGPAKTPSHKGKPRPPVVELPGDTLGFGPAKTPSHKGKPRPPVVELPGDTLRFGPATTPGHEGKAGPPVESPGPARAPSDKGKTRPQGLFVFGDSLVDNGNNNYLLTTARADMPPYGIDSATHLPTGRFSNGYNIPDLISQAMGKPLLLPYLSPELTGKKLLDGANFASAGVGILNDTGIQFANIVKIVDQLKDFQEYQKKVSALVGEKEKTKLIRKSLVVITLGGNDFVNNYFLLPYSPRSILYDIPSYVKLLISEYRVILMKLYEMGARRMLVTGTGPLGCVPAEMALRSRDGQCITDMNKASVLFNTQLAELLRSLNRYLGADVFIGANTHQIHMNFISKPKDFGFVSSNVACCGQGPYNGIGLCSLVSNLCTNRDEYAFWDAFHPSEMANKIIVDQILKGTREYIYPMNLSTVMHLYAMGA